MTLQEITEFLEMLSSMDQDFQREFYYMVKGAALVAADRE